LSIKIFYDEIEFRLNKSDRVKKFIDKVIREEKMIPGDLNFVFTNNKNLREINVKFLKRDHNTDVITFNYNFKNKINGEIYISIETVKSNALKYIVNLEEEVIRVMIHGVLHLCGFDDKTKGEKKLIRRIEDARLNDYLKYY
jgi:rRNA maturation RNase YbeY